MTLRPHRHHLRRGYTLVEMLVGIGILSIAGMLLIPNLVDRGTFAIQAAARAIVSDIVFAQSDALANQEYRRFQFIETPEGQDGYVGYCVLRVSPESFFYPYDPVRRITSPILLEAPETMVGTSSISPRMTALMVS